MTTFLKIILIFLNIFVLNFDNYNFYKHYQLCGYKLKKTLKYFNKNTLFFAKLIMLFFVNISLLFTNNFYIVFSIIFAFLIIIFALNFSKKRPTKNRLIFTKRFTRIFVLQNFLSVFLLIFACFFAKNIVFFKHFLGFFGLIFYINFIVSHILITPVEKIIKHFYIKKAKIKLKKMPSLKIVAITGSFAKTSVKNYLFEMLKTKFKVCKSQKSFNTEMGITKTILNDLKFSDEILILEFGADHNHDIKKLCKIAKPTHSIITGVTNQHLETFKTMGNLIKTKFELSEFMHNSGFLVLNEDNCITKNFFEKSTVKHKFLVSINSPKQAKNKHKFLLSKALIKATKNMLKNFYFSSKRAPFKTPKTTCQFSNLKSKTNINKNGVIINKTNNKTYNTKTRFFTNNDKINVKNNKKFSQKLWAENVETKFNETKFDLCTNSTKISCKTKLLGKHNVLNVLLSAQMALILGVNLNEIAKVVELLTPAPHRLNLTQNFGKFILDDSFNANPEGVKCALDVLKTFKGKKIVITPGLVELGNMQFDENVKLGALLKEIDIVLITNFVNKTAILKGLENAKNQVFCFENLSKATKKLEAVFNCGDCVLFLNDLPDNYV